MPQSFHWRSKLQTIVRKKSNIQSNGRKHFSLNRRLLAEQLEDRRMLAVFTWQAEEGDWNNPENWGSEVMPGPEDDVFVNGGIVNLSGQAEVNSVELANGELNVIQSGTLTSSFFDIHGGTVNLSGHVEVNRVELVNGELKVIESGTLALQFLGGQFGWLVLGSEDPTQSARLDVQNTATVDSQIIEAYANGTLTAADNASIAFTVVAFAGVLNAANNASVSFGNGTIDGTISASDESSIMFGTAIVRGVIEIVGPNIDARAESLAFDDATLIAGVTGNQHSTIFVKSVDLPPSGLGGRVQIRTEFLDYVPAFGDFWHFMHIESPLLFPPEFVIDPTQGQVTPSSRFVVGLNDVDPTTEYITATIEHEPENPPVTDDESREPIGEECGPCNEDRSDTGGDSVLLHNGAYHYSAVDLEIPGRGFNWSFQRTYRSDLAFIGPLGHNWQHNYERRLIEITPQNQSLYLSSFPDAAAGDVIHVDGFNRADIYVLDGSSYHSPAGYYTQLTRNIDGSYVERDRDGTKTSYSAPDPNGVERLTEIRDRNNNTMLFEYDSNGLLSVVTDTLGRQIKYFYTNGLLTEIVDFAGRVLGFEYDQNDDLVAVTSPAVTDTPNLNNFRDGRTERYEYFSTSPEFELRHKLTSITAPNEVASGGSPRIVLTYETDRSSQNFGRVISQQVGGINESEVPAGGTIHYNYQWRQVIPAPDKFDTEVRQTTVTDRNGNRTTYVFNQHNDVLLKTEETNRDVRSNEGDYQTRYQVNQDYRRKNSILPAGNHIKQEFDIYNANRFQQGNVLATTQMPDTDRKGDQTEIRSEMTYEPIYNQIHLLFDPRGLDSSYDPPNEGPNTKERYRTEYIYDFQEGTDYVGLGNELGISAQEVQQLLMDAGIDMGLADQNGDNRTDQISGNLIQVKYPKVNLLAGSNQAGIEGDSVQEIIETWQYNDFGQVVEHTDLEGNVTEFDYYPEQDPDGDEIINNSGGNPLTGGYLRQIARDPATTNIRTAYQYDAVGNVTRVIDGRGIATDYAVNQLNEVVQITRAAAVDLLMEDPDPIEPLALEPFGYIERMFYNFNGNVVQRSVEDRGNTSDVGIPGDVDRDGDTDGIDFLALQRSHTGDADHFRDWKLGYGTNSGFVDTFYDYDILDQLVEEATEVNQDHLLTTRYRYDANQNRTLTILPEENATSAIYDERDLLFRTTRGEIEPSPLLEQGDSTGNNTSNTFSDLTKSWTAGHWVGRTLTINKGAGKGQSRLITDNSSTELTLNTSWDTLPDSTSEYRITLTLLAPDDPVSFDVRGGIFCQCTTYHYDANANVIEIVDAADSDESTDNNSDRGGPGDRTRYIYDGFDRLTSVVDSVGNQTVRQYDPASNVVRTMTFGSVSGASPTSDGPDVLPGPVSLNGTIQVGNLVNANLLAASEQSHDELNRVYQTDQVLFVNTTPTVRTPDVEGGAADIGKGDITPSDDHAIPGIVGITIKGRVTTRMEYDRSSRTTFLVEDDGDTFKTFYDGADRVIRTEDPEGNIVEYAYDDNHNLIETRETDVSQIPGVANEIFLTTSFYDSLDRLQQTVDNLGQTMFYHYDPRNNLVATADAQGPLTGASIVRRAFADGPRTVNSINDFGNVVLRHYDGINRLTFEETVLTESGSGDGVHIGASIFGIKNDPSAPESFPPLADSGGLDGKPQGGGDGIIRIGTVYDDNSLVTAQVDDNGNVTLYLYDNLNRRVAETKGLVSTSTLTKTLIMGDRQIVTPTVATINNPAFIPEAQIQNQLDAAQLRIDGIEPLFPPLADRLDDQPPTTTVYGIDSNDNLLIFEDENDNEIFTKYDALNRPIAKRIFRAGQADSFVGDLLFAPNPMSDPSNPTDLLNPPVVVGTTSQDLQYDGLSRLVLATDNNDPTTSDDDSLIAYAYDSLSRVIEESQQIGNLPAMAISSAWRAANLRSRITYPDDRTVVLTYDDLDRTDAINDFDSGTSTGSNAANTLVDSGENWANDQWVGATLQIVDGTGSGQVATITMNSATNVTVDQVWAIMPDATSKYEIRKLVADYDYIGTGRVLRRTNGNGTKLTYLDDTGSIDAGYDGLRRPIQLRHLDASDDLIVGFTYTYDRMNNKLTEEKLHDQNSSELYSYDSTYRLIDFQRGTLNAGHDAIATPDPDFVQQQEWQLDGVGNWSEVATTENGTTDTETREHSSINELIRREDGVDTDLTYDDNGNLTADGRLIYEWDFANRLRNVYRALEGGGRQLIAVYSYDAQGRRTRKVVIDSEGVSETTDFYYDGWRVLEERGGGNNIEQQFVCGNYIDEPLVLDKADGRRFYYHQNSLFSVFGLSDEMGNLVEAYQYDSYGHRTIVVASINQDFDNPYTFTGRREDAETGLQFYRTRYFAHELGRFISRDLLGILVDEANKGSLYAYVGQNSINRIDPLGLTTWDIKNIRILSSRDGTLVFPWPPENPENYREAPNKLGATATRIEVTRVNCKCDSDNLFHLNGEVEITFRVYNVFKKKYNSDEVMVFAKRGEQEHTNDYLEWARGKGKIGADQIEQHLRGVPYKTAAQCRKNIVDILTLFLQGQLSKIKTETYKRYDETGLHDFSEKTLYDMMRRGGNAPHADKEKVIDPPPKSN